MIPGGHISSGFFSPPIGIEKGEHIMPGLNKRELTSKPLRMDSRMARDLERLSDYTGYSQNEIILMSIKKYLFENSWAICLRDMVEEKCLLRIEKEVRIMRGETHLKYGDMTVDVVKSENANGNINLYVATIRLRNKLGEIFYEDVQELDMSGKDWEYYKEFLYEVVE